MVNCGGVEPRNLCRLRIPKFFHYQVCGLGLEEHKFNRRAIFLRDSLPALSLFVTRVSDQMRGRN